jgi:hypothetical protein
MNGESSVNRDARLETLAAEITLAAYRVVGCRRFPDFARSVPVFEMAENRRIGDCQIRSGAQN